MTPNKLRTCNSCGWVAFAVTRAFAVAEVAKFNAYYDSLTKKQQKDYYNNTHSKLQDYELCFLCSGPHINFRDFKPNDCDDGHTMQPIIYESETT